MLAVNVSERPEGPMGKLLGLADLGGMLGACTLGFVPPPPGENEISRYCRSEGHLTGTVAYAACLSDVEGLVLVQDFAHRNGGITPFR